MRLQFLLLCSLTAKAAMYKLSDGSDVIGHNQHTSITKGETIAAVIKDYEIGINELLTANPGIDKNNLKVGQELIIPTKFVLPSKKIRSGIVVNMAELRLYYFPKDKNVVYTYPVAMGRSGWRTPTKTTSVRGKIKDPVWHVPASIREHAMDTYGNILPEKVMPGPDNPLGKYAIYLKEKGILIHGTNNPASIGKHVSSGCIRMFNNNVRDLYKMVSVGEPVHLVNHDHKLGYDRDGNLYLESHPEVEDDNIEKNYHNSVDLENKLIGHRHDFSKVQKITNDRDGIAKKIN